MAPPVAPKVIVEPKEKESAVAVLPAIMFSVAVAIETAASAVPVAEEGKLIAAMA
jgi:hypothetical protein